MMERFEEFRIVEIGAARRHSFAEFRVVEQRPFMRQLL